MKINKTMTIDNKTYVKPDFRGKEAKEKVIDAAINGKLDTYVMDPITNKPIKVPVELVRKMQNGESVTYNDIFEYANKN